MKKLFQIIDKFFSFPLGSLYENECNHKDTWEDKNKRIAQYCQQIGQYAQNVIKNEQKKGNIPS